MAQQNPALAMQEAANAMVNAADAAMRRETVRAKFVKQADETLKAVGTDTPSARSLDDWWGFLAWELYQREADFRERQWRLAEDPRYRTRLDPYLREWIEDPSPPDRLRSDFDQLVDSGDVVERITPLTSVTRAGPGEYVLEVTRAPHPGVWEKVRYGNRHEFVLRIPDGIETETKLLPNGGDSHAIAVVPPRTGRHSR